MSGIKKVKKGQFDEFSRGEVSTKKVKKKENSNELGCVLASWPSWVECGCMYVRVYVCTYGYTYVCTEYTYVSV